jgi:hypothetical protein
MAAIRKPIPAAAADGARRASGGLAPTAAPQPSKPLGVKDFNDEQQFLNWIASFENRMKLKETENEKKAMAQAIRAGEEMALIQERKEHEEQERLRQLEREEELRLEEEARLAREAAESARIEKMTENMSPEARARWIEDDAEIQRLEKEMERRRAAMEKRGDAINELVWQYEERLRKEALDAKAREEEARRVEEQHQQQLAEERGVVEAECVEGRQSIQSEAAEERRQLHQTYLSEGKKALEQARVSFYQRLPQEAKDHVNGLTSQAEKDAFYDEAMQLETLMQGLQRLMKKSSNDVPIQPTNPAE